MLYTSETCCKYSKTHFLTFIFSVFFYFPNIYSLTDEPGEFIGMGNRSNIKGHFRKKFRLFELEEEPLPVVAFRTEKETCCKYSKTHFLTFIFSVFFYLPNIYSLTDEQRIYIYFWSSIPSILLISFSILV